MFFSLSRLSRDVLRSGRPCARAVARKGEYGEFPAGSRALVPSNGGPPRGGLEVKEQVGLVFLCGVGGAR